MANASQDADATGDIRRASGRVRKQPDVFAPSAYNSGKRKRGEIGGAETDIDQQDDQSSGDEISDESEDQDADAPAPRKRKASQKTATQAKKPAIKKAKTNGSGLPSHARSNGVTKKRVINKAKAVRGVDVREADGLFAEVFSSGYNFNTVAANWLKRFGQHESGSLADLINFVLKSAGCDIKVTEHDIEDPDSASSRLSDIQDEFQATNPTEYPLIAKGRAGTSFRESLSAFLNSFIKTLAADGTLYASPELIENTQAWLSTMTSAANRAFRHTATVASLAIMTAMAEVGRERSVEAAATQRQVDTERKKSKPNASRIKTIEQKAEEQKSESEYIKISLKDWFDVVFIHRYRDVDPNIRRDCMTALGDWIINLPEVFFDGTHLRYLGWVLSDTVASTRLEVIRQLSRLYKEKTMVVGLKTFTERFRPRLVEIAASDTDTAVRAAGIELLDLLREDGLLEPDDVDAVGRLIYDVDPKARQAVARFFAEIVNDLFNSTVDELGGSETVEEALPEPGEDNYALPSLEWLKLKSVAEMMLAYDNDEELPADIGRGADGSLVLKSPATASRFTLAADALYESIDTLQEWEAIAGYLLFDHSASTTGTSDDIYSQLKAKCALEDKEEVVLLELLSASVKRSIVELTDNGAGNKAKLTKKQKEQLNEEQEEAARRLSALIPSLLHKFGDAPGTAAAVLRMESVFNIPSLRDLQQSSDSRGALLEDLRKQFMAHTTDEVLAPASDAILHAKAYGALDDVAEDKLSTLWEDVVSNLAQIVNPSNVGVRGAASTEELAAISNNLLRIGHLSQVSNCVAPLEDKSLLSEEGTQDDEYNGAIDYVLALVERALPTEGETPLQGEDAVLEDQIAARAADAALRFMQWKFHSIIQTINSTASGYPYDDLEVLAGRRDAFANALLSVLTSRKPSEDVALSCAGALLDLHASAKVLKTAKRKADQSDDYEVLIIALHPSQMKSVMRVFAAAERNYAKLSGKRLNQVGKNAESGDEEEAIDINADPASDPESSEDEDDDDDDTQVGNEASQQRREKRLRLALMAEQRLCILTRSIILALHSGTIQEAHATRKRLERNRAKLGTNFKEILAYLNIDEMNDKKKTRAQAAKKASLAAAAARKGQAKSAAKSKATVEESEDDGDDEDRDEDDEALRNRGLLVDVDVDEEEGEDAGAGNEEAEVESILGD